MTSPQSAHVRWQHALLTLTIVVVTSQCVRGAPVSDGISTGEQEERWLADQSFYDLEYEVDKPQADGRELVTNELCPPVPKRLPVGGCEVETCSSDRECAQKQLKCCYNGCVYTCLPEVKPPPYFDWIREPARRLQFGQSWLVPGPDFLLHVKLCSTSPARDDSDPLMCPHGYECSIDDVGRSVEGIPNRGHCVKVTEEMTSESILVGLSPNNVNSTPGAADGTEDSASRHACHMDGQKILLSGHSLILEGRTCLCQETTLICDDKSASPSI